MRNCLISSSFLGLALAFAVSTASAAATDSGVQSLFNGHDLSGWTGNLSLWSVKDGTITGQTQAEDPLKNNTFLIWTNGVVSDFELRFSYKITPNNTEGFANSGCQYRSQVVDKEKFIVGGYQADFEAGTTYSGILYEERGRGILANRGQATLVKEDPQNPEKTQVEVLGTIAKSEDIQAALKANDWNQYIIIARGNRLLHIINGRVTIDVTDDQPSKAARSGVLALQLHAGPPMTVQFKDVQLRPMK